MKFTVNKIFGLLSLSIALFTCADTQNSGQHATQNMDFYTEAENEKVAALLHQVRDAVGITATSKIDLHLEGKSEFMGNEVVFVFAADSNEDAWFSLLEGPVAYAFGYDSGDYIVKFMNGISRKAGPAEKSNIRLTGTMQSHSWLLENAPFLWSLEDDEDSGIMLYYQLVDSYSRGVIQINKETYLPEKWVNHTWQGEEVFRFEGQLDNQTPWMPAIIEITDSDGVNTTTQLSNRIENNTSVKDQLHQHLKQSDDFNFENMDPVVDLRRNWRGLLMVMANVNNSEPGWFILDSGAGVSVLDNRFVDKLGVEAIGKKDMTGVGGREHAAYHRVDQFRVGPLTVDDYILTSLDLSFLDDFFDQPTAGIIGSGIFGRSVVEIDIEESRASFYDESQFEGREIEWMPMVVDYGRPAIKGNIENHEGYFLLDTGGSFGIVIHSNTVTGLELLESRQTREAGIGGVGGQTIAQVGKISSLEFGDFAHSDLEAIFITESQGAFSDPYYLGTIGMRILREYKIIFDYQNLRIALMPTP
ncbi:MAG: aspartyl protease family protein [Balneolaceae bacterium]|nr:aspartyl protease family protein [Balneolaceae bacterium]